MKLIISGLPKELCGDDIGHQLRVFVDDHLSAIAGQYQPNVNGVVLQEEADNGEPALRVEPRDNELVDTVAVDMLVRIFFVDRCRERELSLINWRRSPPETLDS